MSSGLVSGKGMMSACQQMTPLNSDMAFAAVNQVQGKKGYLTLFSPLSFLWGCDRAQTEAGCWATGNFSLIQDDHSNSFLWAHPQSSKQYSETWFSFAEDVLIKVSHIMIFQVFYYSLLNSCFDHLQCVDAMLTGLNIG